MYTLSDILLNFKGVTNNDELITWDAVLEKIYSFWTTVKKAPKMRNKTRETFENHAGKVY